MTLIKELSLDEIERGSLHSLFTNGVCAAKIASGTSIRELWGKLLDDEAELMPWQAPLSDIVRNHFGSSDITASLGDVLYFQPGHHGYIARKVEIERDGRGDLVAEPSAFWQGSQQYAVPPSILSDCYEISARILNGMVPAGRTFDHFRVAVQRIKYQESVADLDRMARMIRNSLARWGRVGFDIDANRGSVIGQVSGKGVQDLLGIAMLSRTGRKLWTLLDKMLGSLAFFIPADGERVIEGEHFDDRYFSALCGDRPGIATQIFSDGLWQDIPVESNALIVFPGKLATQEFGIPPVRHRVIYPHREVAEQVDPVLQNVTLLIGAVRSLHPVVAEAGKLAQPA